jgi:glycosyltransferase involved in cell wall biosynthesis
MRKVLHIITGLKNGGAEAILYRIISDNSQNFQHEVISLSDKGYYGVLLTTAGIKITTLNISSFFSIFSRFPKLYILIKSAKPDVVQTWMYHADIIGGMAAKFAGVPKIVWGVHSTFLNPKETKITTMLAVILSKYLSNYIPDKIICCSETALKSHEKIGYSSHKMVIINNGVDTNFFTPNAEQGSLIRRTLALGEDIFVMGMIARWHPVKDHKMLLRALSEIKLLEFKWKCLLVGEEMTKENVQLNKMIHENGLQDYIICLGSRQDIATVLNALDLHILTSSSESFGNVTVEAMSCSIPCIMTDVGEAKNLLAEHGWIVPIRNPLHLAQIIKHVYSEFVSVDNWQVRKLEIREKIKNHYSISQMIQSYTHIWS